MLEFLETDLNMADLCRKHNITPGALYKWRTRFIDGGKKAIESKDIPEILRHNRDTDELEQTIAEQIIVIEELKKLWRKRQKDDALQTGTTNVLKKNTTILMHHAICCTIVN